MKLPTYLRSAVHRKTYVGVEFGRHMNVEATETTSRINIAAYICISTATEQI